MPKSRFVRVNKPKLLVIKETQWVEPPLLVQSKVATFRHPIRIIMQQFCKPLNNWFMWLYSRDTWHVQQRRIIKTPVSDNRDMFFFCQISWRWEIETEVALEKRLLPLPSAQVTGAWSCHFHSLHHLLFSSAHNSFLPSLLWSSLMLYGFVSQSSDGFCNLYVCEFCAVVMNNNQPVQFWLLNWLAVSCWVYVTISPVLAKVWYFDSLKLFFKKSSPPCLYWQGGVNTETGIKETASQLCINIIQLCQHS